MYVQAVRIKNIRGFADVDLDLRRPDGDPSGWTVLAGRNGSGKSTLLQAIALCVVGPTTSRSLQESFAGWIHSGKIEAYIEVELTEDHFDYSGTRRRWILSRSRPEGSRGPEVIGARLRWMLATGAQEPELSGDSRYRIDHPAGEPNLWTSDVGRAWFLAGYGPSRRLSGHGTAAQRLMVGPDRNARLVTLFREDASLLECVQWLRELYLKRLEGKPAVAELENLVLGLLNDGLLPDDLVVERVTSDGLWVRQHGVVLPLPSLSDGYCEDNEGTDIDHFWPQARYPERSFRWDNYLWACSHCNSNQKRDQFPLDASGNPLLVDPTVDEPLDHLAFSPATGEYLPLTSRGQPTIDVFGLSRANLGRGRSIAWPALQALLLLYAQRKAADDPKAARIEHDVRAHPFAGVFVALLRIAASPAAAILIEPRCLEVLAAHPEILTWV